MRISEQEVATSYGAGSIGNIRKCRPPTKMFYISFSSTYSNPVRKSALKGLRHTIDIHILGKYTPFDSLIDEPQNEEAVSEARKKVEKIIASWRGGN